MIVDKPGSLQVGVANRCSEELPCTGDPWKDATWAIDFYLKNGFRLAEEEEKNMLLKKYWKIAVRQVETSVVLMDEK